jgi:hypothetical protein
MQHIVQQQTGWGEAPWSKGESQGLTVGAMVLWFEFDSRVHLKTSWLRQTSDLRPLDGRKIKKQSKGASHTKNIFLKKVNFLTANRVKIFPNYVYMDYIIFEHTLIWDKSIT